MSFQSEKLSIETYISDNKAQFQGADIVFENVTKPNNSVNWVRVNILNSDSRQISLGSNPYYRYKGLLIFQIFTRPNTGSGKSNQLSDTITNLFRGVSLNSITFKTPMKDTIGEVDGWFQVNVSVPFFREEFSS